MIHNLMAKITVWKMNKDGATAIEYGLIAAGISVAIVVVVFALGGDVKAAFEKIEGSFH